MRLILIGFPLVFLFIFIFSYSSLALDFCVADIINGHETFIGYPCKNPTNVTVDDFVFSGFANRGNTSNMARSSVLRPTVKTFPGLNGMGLTVSRIDIAPNGGVVGLHVHPHSAELVHVAEGTVLVGFISGSATNTVYVKKLKKGDLMVIPQGLLHFQVNYGKRHAVVFASFGSVDPGLQLVRSALFGNNLPSFLVEKTTSVDVDEVMRLKELLGGSG
ncbi:Auxin-binding protein ABP20 [Linum perenne]